MGTMCTRGNLIWGQGLFSPADSTIDGRKLWDEELMAQEEVTVVCAFDNALSKNPILLLSWTLPLSYGGWETSKKPPRKSG